MTSCDSSVRDRTVLFLSTPALWPAWPFLPVVRRCNGHQELGVVFDSRSAGLMGLSTMVYFTNMFELPATWEKFLALPHETFDGAEELFEAGWRVD